MNFIQSCNAFETPLTPCLVESVIFSGNYPDGKLIENPIHSQNTSRKIADPEFHEHEQRWTEMCEEVTFSSALVYLRTRMFIDKDMKVITDETQLHHLALALYRYRSGDIDESIHDREFMNGIFHWNEADMGDLKSDFSLSEKD